MRLRKTCRASGSPRTASSSGAARRPASFGSFCATASIGTDRAARSTAMAAMARAMLMTGSLIAHRRRSRSLPHDFAFLEAKRDLALGRLGAIRAVHRIPLQIDAEVLADRAGRRVNGIGGAHHLAVLGDGVLAFKHLQHDRSRGHECDEILEEGLVLVDVVELP